MDETVTVGVTLRRQRLAVGLSQEQVAERAGLSVEAVGAIERGQRRPRSATLHALATALGLSPLQVAALGHAVNGRRRRRREPPPPGVPVPSTPLVGRTHDLAVLAYLLGAAAVRLLTLRGPGGVGKTRLAQQVAVEMAGVFPDGVVWVDLAQLHDPALVEATVAQQLGVRDARCTPLREQLLACLCEKQLLLFLDNFEHLLAARDLVAALLESCPGVSLVVTSRAALQLAGEQEYVVAPLGLPGQAETAVEAVERAPAVALFMDRARAVIPGLQLTATTAPAVAAICRQLDGLPLAIELAAALTRVLPPQEMLAQVGDPATGSPATVAGAGQGRPSRWDALGGGSWELPERQQTLRRTIAWSYDLLTPGEQALFRQLGVFAGGGPFAALAVLGEARGQSLEESRAQLRGLSDKSLVVLEDGGECFCVLETIRADALDRLVASGEAEAAWRQHALYYLALAEQAEPELTGPDQGAWMGRLEQEHPNLRVALAWAEEHGAVEIGLRLTWGVWRFWVTANHLREGRRWLEGILALSEGEGTARVAHLRAQVLWAAGVAAKVQADYARATALFEECLALCRALGHDVYAGAALNQLGLVAQAHGEYERATALLEESVAVARALGDQVPLDGRAAMLRDLAALLRVRGEYGRAAALLEESIALCRKAVHAWGIAYALMVLGDIALEQQDQDRAAGAYMEGLTLHQSVGSKWGVALCLDGLAKVAAAQEREARAAWLFAAAEGLRDAIGAPLSPSDRPAYEAALSAVRSAIGDEAFAAAWTAGQTLTPEQAVAAALEDSGGRSSTTRRDRAGSPND